MNYLFILFIIYYIIYCTKAQYDDVRCKCVCPTVKMPPAHVYPKPNATQPVKYSNKVFVHSFREPSRCKCKNVVEEAVLLAKPNICEQCECQWQRRNTKTIQVTVIFIITLVCILTVYMLFLLCLDPYIASRKAVSYQPQVDTQDTTAMEQHEICRYSILENTIDEDYPNVGPSGQQRVLSIDENVEVHAGGDGPQKLMSRVKNRVCKVKDDQLRWKGQVKQQRRHIYDTHSMLN